MKKKILIVDDNSTNIYMLESLLKGSGFDVLSAENGEKALEKALLTIPDLIVSDILMPVMDGYTLCREWKSNNKLKHIPFVFFTATYTEPTDEVFALSIGADRFILKPQDPETLLGIINEFFKEDYKVKQITDKPLGEEMEFFRQYNEVLFNKLEKKILALKETNHALKISENKIKTLFNEKEILLKEVHHRIKNNMNTMMGLLSLQLNSLKETSAISALKDAISRLETMRVLYDKLYLTDNINEMSIEEYLTALIKEVIKMFSNDTIVEMEIKIDDFMLSTQLLNPIGIIANEIVTNAMKHAFTDKKKGKILICGFIKKGEVTLSIEDDGNGIPEYVDIENSAGFGINLIGMLTKQINGDITIIRGNGTKFILKFNI
ncbi:MAG: response regulator [Spirochaetes bacterium]|nr:response regulator [Spirochaetota bacterium]